MGCFLRPYTINVYRPTREQTVGVQSYGGLDKEDEVLVLEAIPANIRLARTGRQISDIPSDTAFRPFFYIVFKADMGSVRTHDVIVDNTGRRFQVTADGWSSMGYQALCELLEI